MYFCNPLPLTCFCKCWFLIVYFTLKANINSIREKKKKIHRYLPIDIASGWLWDHEGPPQKVNKKLFVELTVANNLEENKQAVDQLNIKVMKFLISSDDKLKHLKASNASIYQYKITLYHNLLMLHIK